MIGHWEILEPRKHDWKPFENLIEIVENNPCSIAMETSDWSSLAYEL